MSFAPSIDNIGSDFSNIRLPFDVSRVVWDLVRFPLRDAKPTHYILLLSITLWVLQSFVKNQLLPLRTECLTLLGQKTLFKQIATLDTSSEILSKAQDTDCKASTELVFDSIFK